MRDPETLRARTSPFERRIVIDRLEKEERGDLKNASDACCRAPAMATVYGGWRPSSVRGFLRKYEALLSGMTWFESIGKDAMAYSTVTKYAHRTQFSGRKEAIPPEAPDMERSPVDETILTALAEFPFPFSSVRELSRRIGLPRPTVHLHPHRHLTQSLRFTVRHLRWVPHF
jgi:hypothetical protein